jgi:hypothetical protein
MRRRHREHVLDEDDEGPHGPGMADPTEPFKDISSWMWFSAASRRYSGEPRVKVDDCALFSFYDPALQGQTLSRTKEEMEGFNITTNGTWSAPENEAGRQMGLQNLTRRRRVHQLDSVTTEDGLIMRNLVRSTLKEALSDEGNCSGIEWHSIVREYISNYGTMFRDLHYALKDAAENTADLSPRARLEPVRSLTHWFLLQVLEYPPSRPYPKEDLASLFSPEGEAARKAFERCSSEYTAEGIKLNAREEVHSSAVNITLSGICRTIVRIGMEVEYFWLLNFNMVIDEDDSASSPPLGFADKVSQLTWHLEELLAWLGWADQETTCRGGCTPGVNSRPLPFLWSY